jgi:hypothetical protein
MCAMAQNTTKSQEIPTSAEVLEDICPLGSLVSTPRTIRIIDKDVAIGVGGRGAPRPYTYQGGGAYYPQLPRIPLRRSSEARCEPVQTAQDRRRE